MSQNAGSTNWNGKRTTITSLIRICSASDLGTPSFSFHFRYIKQVIASCNQKQVLVDDCCGRILHLNMAAYAFSVILSAKKCSVQSSFISIRRRTKYHLLQTRYITISMHLLFFACASTDYLLSLRSPAKRDDELYIGNSYESIALCCRHIDAP